MVFRKAAKKAYAGAKKAFKRRYGLNKRSKGLKYGTMAKDILMLKSMVNAEKKSYQALISNQVVGQVNANNTGALCLDITPYISQGAAVDQRNGASVKLCSALYQFQFIQQSALTLRQRFIIEFWVNKGTQLDAATALTYIHNTSTFSGVTDSNSPRNQDRFSDFALVRKITRTLAPEQLTGDNTTATFDVPIKFNRGKGHHIRLVTNPTGVPQDCLNGQMFMTVRADIGNSSTTTVTITRPVPIVAISTGSIMRFAYRCWYYDN